MSNRPKGMTYRDAGVDIDAGEALVERIKPMAAATRRAGADGGLGGFGGLFDLKAAGYEDPILVSGTDGVGTKLKIAIDAGIYDTVGIDLVAMCVNDIVVQGAEPLFFLDYFATGTLEVEMASAVVSGIAEGCSQAGCTLIGGETAEMPGLYAGGDFDLAGFSVGAVERANVLTGENIAEGDAVLGMASSGLHSNGFSLVRHVIADLGIGFDASSPFDESKSLGAALLEPTRIYVKACLAALSGGLVSGFAHITGGGITENIPRVLPNNLAAEINRGWDMPPVFGWLQARGNIADEEMLRTFNCGIGMVAVVPADKAAAARQAFEGAGETVFDLGRIVVRADNEPGVIVK